MLTLGIDTSNYATSLAVFDTDAGEVVCDCKKFLPVKEGQLGLRQSDALFHHTAALPAMLAELGARADLTQVRAVGVSARPRPVEGSYMPCFLAGVSAATAFSLSRANFFFTQSGLLADIDARRERKAQLDAEAVHSLSGVQIAACAQRRDALGPMAQKKVGGAAGDMKYK